MLREHFKTQYKKIQNNMSFGTRLFAAFFGVSIPVLIIISIGLYIFLNKGSQETVSKTMLQTLERTRSAVENVIIDTESLSRNIIYDTDVQKLLADAAAGESYPETDKVKYFINSFIVIREYIESVVLMGNDDTLFSTEKAYTNVSSKSQIEKKWWYSQLDKTSEPYSWFPYAKNDGTLPDVQALAASSADLGGTGNPRSNAGASADISENTVASANNTPQNLMLTRIIRSVDDYQTPVGRMMIYLKDSYMEDILNQISWGETLSVWICDNEGRPLLFNTSAAHRMSCLQELLSSGRWSEDAQPSANMGQSTILSLDGHKYVVGIESFADNSWSIVMAVPLSEVNENRSIVLIQILCMILLILTIVIVVSKITSRTLSKPIRQISEIMDTYQSPMPDVLGAADSRKIPQNVPQPTPSTADVTHAAVPATSADSSTVSAYSAARSAIPAPGGAPDFESRRDEVGTIYRSYEQLVQRMETLIREIYIKDLEKKDAELALMQSQINPHFLYNTLDSINWMAMAAGQDDISEMVTALSDTFRLSLKRTNSSYVCISQELEYLDSYLTLQKYRFGGRLTYSVDVPEPIHSLYLLRFLLQPLIENAIKHGISPREDGGCIDLTMDIPPENPSVLEIHVINDGDNIDLAAMEKLLAFDVQTQTFLSFDQNSYGLQNISRRIKIVHGPDFGLHYSITEQRRTDCCLMLPVVETDPT